MNGTSDFVNSTFSKNSRELVPEACCKKEKSKKECTAARKATTIDMEYFNEGCSEALQDKLSKNSNILFGIGIGVAVMEILVVVMGIGFACSIDK